MVTAVTDFLSVHRLHLYKQKQNSMKKNMGNIDKIIRVLLAAVVAVLYFTGIVTGTLGIVLLVLAGVFVLTSLISFCPLYPIFGINTCPKDK
jgi:uncharacterized membrane protein